MICHSYFLGSWSCLGILWTNATSPNLGFFLPYLNIEYNHTSIEHWQFDPIFRSSSLKVTATFNKTTATTMNKTLYHVTYIIKKQKNLYIPFPTNSKATELQKSALENFLTFYERVKCWCTEFKFHGRTRQNTEHSFTDIVWTRDVEAVHFSAASATALPLPQKCSYFISSYPSHECGSCWPGLAAGLLAWLTASASTSAFASLVWTHKNLHKRQT